MLDAFLKIKNIFRLKFITHLYYGLRTDFVPFKFKFSAILSIQVQRALGSIDMLVQFTFRQAENFNCLYQHQYSIVGIELRRNCIPTNVRSNLMLAIYWKMYLPQFLIIYLYNYQVIQIYLIPQKLLHEGTIHKILDMGMISPNQFSAHIHKL